MSAPVFSVKDIAIDNDLILAPMDGYSEYPFRSICRLHGSGMSYTAFVSAIDLLQDDPKAWHALKFKPEERPVVFQIFDNDEWRLAEASERIVRLDPDIIDINMGCSVRRVSGRGAGAGLLKDPKKIGRIISRLTTSLPVPITAKIRLGWDDQDQNYLDVADAIEQNGGALIAVHARTRSQGYKGFADWDAIGRIKQHVKIPVVGNGDIASLEDIDRAFEHTGCDGIMIGRGAIGNPWIFSRTPRTEISPPRVHAVIMEHLARMLSYHGEYQGILRFRKHLKAYLSGYNLSGELLRSLLTTKSSEELIAAVESLFTFMQPERGADLTATALESAY